MVYSFVKTCIGYSHIKNKKPCQDFSALYKDNNRTIITCCDGHGGDIYIKSEVGSHMASNAVINIFNSIPKSFFCYLSEEELIKKIKLSILCEWNRLIEQHYNNPSFRKKDLMKLNEEERETLMLYPIRAYGTTLTGALLLGDKIIIVQIGDTECLYTRKGQLYKVFDNEDSPVGNVTYSMCQEDAYNYINVKVLDFNNLDGVFLCTDGLTSPYQSYDNFNKSFIKPLMKEVLEKENTSDVEKFIENIALKLGVGDDVSLAFLIKENTNKSYYK